MKRQELSIFEQLLSALLRDLATISATFDGRERRKLVSPLTPNRRQWYARERHG